MPHELYDFIGQGMEDFEAVVGGDLVTFTIAGIATLFTGDLDQASVEGTALSQEGGGMVPTYSGTILARRGQFAAIPDPERALDGKKLVMGGKTYRIASVSADPAAVTFTLEFDSKRR